MGENQGRALLKQCRVLLAGGRQHRPPALSTPPPPSFLAGFADFPVVLAADFFTGLAGCGLRPAARATTLRPLLHGRACRLICALSMMAWCRAAQLRRDLAEARLLPR